MKKLYYLFPCLLWSATVLAQTGAGIKVSAGLSDMVAAGKQTEAYDPVFSQRFAYQLGGYGTLKLGKRLFTRAEVLLESKGAGREALYYFSVPLLLQYRCTDWLSLEGGPQGAVLLRARTALLNYRPLDAGLTLGAGFALKTRLWIGMRYSKSVVNILQEGLWISNSQGFITDKVPLHHSVLQVSAYYSLFNR